MEDKQLDFNAPLLSVRRFSSSAVSTTEGQNYKKIESSSRNRPYVPPYYKSDLKSGPMRNPGAVPFVWEQIPGRRKDGEGSQDRLIERRPIAPKLPPGRILEVKQQCAEKVSEEKITTRPQIDNGLPSRQKDLQRDANVSKFESSKEAMKAKRDSDSEEGDDAYEDALDTLSRTESFFYNCSISGISGLEDMSVKRPGNFATDPQTRDFMMGRFLPAAKAMTSETPQHTSRRQPVIREQPIQVKAVVNGDRKVPLNQYRPNIIPQYVEETMEEDSDDEDDDCHDTRNPSAKACGFLPRFCLKSSFCLLNPVPGMKVKRRASLPSAGKFRPRIKTTYSGSHIEPDPVNNWEAVYKHKQMSGLQPLGDESKLTSESNQLTIWSNSQTTEGSSSRMHSGGSGISPYRSEAIQSPFHEGMGFLGIPKQVKSVKVNNSISYKDAYWGSGSLSPMIEKTVYVDSEHLQTSIAKSSSLDMSGMVGFKENDSVILTEHFEKEDMLAVSCSGDLHNLDLPQEKKISKPKFSEVGSSNLLSSSDRPNPARDRHSLDGFRNGDVLDQEARSFMSSNVWNSGDLDFEKPQFFREVYQGSPDVYSSQFPLAPPLPKSPSDSWLWRTLPSVSSKNSAAFHSRKQCSKPPSVGQTWETIVKTSNVYHSHLRFSEESITPLPQQSET
ncbi:hypothetical protein IFM89_031860 [Coptis chinensis]|uniref:Uncharacterized protein n=1 Tax=Coptis chinensis TaxID=261450 RepID=A0A835H120_9MAGN|nr:hypothetical protein IFM89_031860 [Coptis chinensis]